MMTFKSRRAPDLVKLRAYFRSDRRDQAIRALIDENRSLESDKAGLVAANRQLLDQRETQADLIARAETELSMVRQHVTRLEEQADRYRAEVARLEKALCESVPIVEYEPALAEPEVSL